jgi:hypothetical protein
MIHIHISQKVYEKRKVYRWIKRLEDHRCRLIGIDSQKRNFDRNDQICKTKTLIQHNNKNRVTQKIKTEKLSCWSISIRRSLKVSVGRPITKNRVEILILVPPMWTSCILYSFMTLFLLALVHSYLPPPLSTWALKGMGLFGVSFDFINSSDIVEYIKWLSPKCVYWAGCRVVSAVWLTTKKTSAPSKQTRFKASSLFKEPIQT